MKLINNGGQELILPFTFSWTDINAEINVPIVSLASGDGGRRAGRETLEERSFVASGTIYNANRIENIHERDGISDFIQYTPLKVYQLDNDDRFLYAYATYFNQNWLDNRTELQLSINFVAPKPYFHSNLEYDRTTHEAGFLLCTQPPQDGAYIDTLTADTVIEYANCGNRETFPVIEVEPDDTIENLKIENLKTGSLIQISGEITASQVLEIDCEDVEAKLDGVNSLNLANDEFLIYKFFLTSGLNDIEVSWTGAGNVDILINYRSRWL